MSKSKSLVTILVLSAAFLFLQQPPKADAYLLTLTYSGHIISKNDPLNMFSNVLPGSPFRGRIVYDSAMIDDQPANDTWGQYGPMTSFEFYINNEKYPDSVSASSMNVWNDLQGLSYIVASMYSITGAWIQRPLVMPLF